MKTDKDIMIDSFMARIRELEASQVKQEKAIEQLNISDYLLRQFVFANQDNLLNSFAVFVEENYEECAYHHGYKDIEQCVIDILEDLSGDIDKDHNDSREHFADLFNVLGSLKSSK